MSRVLPVHEQVYPTKLLTQRLEEYVFADGRAPTINRAYAVLVTGKQVYDAVVAAQASLSLTNIDPRYYVGTCFHESGCENEWDTEIATSSCPSGYQSVGAYQIGDEEARRLGFTLPDMLDLQKATLCMVKLAEANRTQLRRFASLSASTPDPDYTDAKGVVWAGGTMRAYLAIAHNHGLGYARATISRYGMNWASYKARNPTDRIVSNTYGEDCVTGGPRYPAAPPSPKPGERMLMLKDPRMSGPDVAEMQKHLKVTTDGIFGIQTDTAVRLFQRSKGLPVDGICGPKTWEALLATS